MPAFQFVMSMLNEFYDLQFIIYLVVALVIAVALVFAIQYVNEKDRKKLLMPKSSKPSAAPTAAVTRVAGARRRVTRRANVPAAAVEEEPSSAEEGEDGDQEKEKKVGKKKQMKIKAKEERKAQRESELVARREQEKRRLEREEERRKEEEEEERLEKEREEEERRLREEREKREEEEYLKMKESFVVEEEGQNVDMTDELKRNLLEEFITFVKTRKVIMLEDLAAEFNLKTQDCIDRVRVLQEEGRLTGVIDDRGKFIYITNDELQAVADFIKQRGRVSISELAENSNRLINLASCDQSERTEDAASAIA